MWTAARKLWTAVERRGRQAMSEACRGGKREPRRQEPLGLWRPLTGCEGFVGSMLEARKERKKEVGMGANCRSPVVAGGLVT